MNEYYLVPLVVYGSLFSVFSACCSRYERNTNRFMNAMNDSVTSTDEATLAKAKETLEEFREYRRFPFGISKVRCLMRAMELGYTDVFKYSSRPTDVLYATCYSKNADFLLKCREDGTITETLVELILYARQCENMPLVVELANKSKL